MSGAITEYVSSRFGESVDAHVLETIKTEEGLAAFFKDRNDSQLFGFAMFKKGLNFHYQIVEYAFAPIPYSAAIVVLTFRDDYLLVGGFNVGKIHAYGIQLTSDTYTEVEGGWRRDMVAEAIYPVEREQFFYRIPRSEVYTHAGVSPEQVRLLPYITSAGLLYDEQGNDVSGEFFIEGIDDGWASGGWTPVKVNYLLILTVLVLGGVLTRKLLLSRKVQMSSENNYTEVKNCE